ncbi:ZIP family metal transporter [Nonlabens agnitus]|nr:ZIP family metal transporter [Nonlabens agnitus]
MMNLWLPFLAVVIGSATAFIFKEVSRQRMKLLLAFSGAFLLSAVATEFLPEIYESGDATFGIYLIAGVFVQIILEFFSKGAEHGHLHVHHDVTKFPIALFVSLCLHAFLEGMPLQEANGMTYGVAIHKIPIAFIFTGFLIANKASVTKILLVISIFAIMSPLGSIIAQYADFADAYMLPIKALVAGIVLHVSTTLILESSDGHQFNLAKMIVMLAGAGLAFMI